MVKPPGKSLNAIKQFLTTKGERSRQKIRGAGIDLETLIGKIQDKTEFWKKVPGEKCKIITENSTDEMKNISVGEIVKQD